MSVNIVLSFCMYLCICQSVCLSLFLSSPSLSVCLYISVSVCLSLSVVSGLRVYRTDLGIHRGNEDSRGMKIKNHGGWGKGGGGGGGGEGDFVGE